jgi:hypothetical protein
VGLGAFLADVLADLEFAEFVDEPGAEGDAEEERGEAGEGGPECNVAEEAERADLLGELLIKEEIEH